MTEWALALGGSLLLALIHAPRNPLFARSRASCATLASLAGGVSLSYVLLHLLLELVESGRGAIHGVLPLGPSPLQSLLFVLLAALVGFFLLHDAADRRPGSRRAESLLVLPYVLYNAVVGGALLGEESHEGPLNLFLFIVALGLHMMVNDYLLTQQLAPERRRAWRVVLAAAPVLGCLAWLLSSVSSDVFYVLLAVIVGSNVLTVLRRELPSPEDTRVGAFLAGAGLVAGVTLLQWWV